jgi:prophage antirepressor-like protein
MSPKYHTKHGAKLIELRRVAAELERQAKKRAAESGLKEAEKEPMANETVKKKITHERGGRLGEKVVDIIRAKLLLDFEATEDELVGIVRHMGGDPRHLSCRAQLKRLRDNQSGARYMDYWRNYFEILAGVRQLPTVSVPRVEQEEERSGVFETAEMVDSPPKKPLAVEPKTIEFNGASIRVIDTGRRDKDGDRVLEFVAKDLVEAVEASWSGHSLDHIPAEYRGMVSVSTPYGAQQMVTLTESGMDMYLFRSDKPAALPWQKHLAEEVLPSIRKTGTYTAPGVARQLPPAAIDIQSMATTIATAVSLAVVRSMHELMPRRRTAPRYPNPEQQTIPLTEEPPSPPVAESVAELRPHEVMRLAEQDQATDRKVLSVMIKRLAGVVKGMPTVEYGARMSVAYHQIEDELVKYGHDMQADSREANRDGNRLNSLDWFEEKGIIKLVMRIVEGLYSAKMAAKST